MKTRFQTFLPLQFPGRALLAAVAVLALWTAQLTAGDEKPAVPAAERIRLSTTPVEKPEPAVDEHVVGQAERSRQLVPPRGCPPDLILADGIAIQAA